MRIAALDVHYGEPAACAAAVLFEAWESDTIVRQVTVQHTAAAGDYAPGQFYQRELAPLLAVLKALDEPLATVVIDGYCTLSPEGAPGLGAHLSGTLGNGALDNTALDPTTPIVGVAKNRYRTAEHALEVLRGGSQKPLYVTALGIDPAVAAQHVATMAGSYRIPTLLKAVDRLARDGLAAS